MPGSPYDASGQRPDRLSVLMQDGKPVAASIDANPVESIAAANRQLKKLKEKADAASPDDTTPYGYIAFMGRRQISRLQDLMEARYDEGHRSAWVQDVDGVECTACACGVLVPGRVGRDFTEKQFQDAEGHLPYSDPEQDPLVCPRCGHGLPDDREPRAGTGFWSLTVQRGYVCGGCHDHQMHLGYGPRNLGDEVWPVTVPQRFYDESCWPPRQGRA